MQKVAQQEGRLHAAWICNINQSQSFQPAPQFLDACVFPAVLRSSLIFVEITEDGRLSSTGPSRPLHPMETFAVQGLPVFLPTDHPAMRVRDFRALLERAIGSLSSESPPASYEPLVLQLSGNGMHVPSIGKVVMFGLLTSPST